LEEGAGCCSRSPHFSCSNMSWRTFPERRTPKNPRRLGHLRRRRMNLQGTRTFTSSAATADARTRRRSRGRSALLFHCANDCMIGAGAYPQGEAVSTIAEWLATLGMAEYAERFAKNGIDLSVVQELTDEGLKDLGVALGDRRKILRAISEIAGAAFASRAPTTATEPISADAGERRQLADLTYRLVLQGEVWNGAPAFVDRCDHNTQIKVLRPSHAHAPSVMAEVGERADQICFVCPAVAWPRAVPPRLDKVGPEWNDFKRGTPRRSRGRNACTAISRPRLRFPSATVPPQHLDLLRVGIVAHSTPASCRGLKNDHQGRKTDDKP
jgi:SAM domain (Sterile alpha motif)